MSDSMPADVHGSDSVLDLVDLWQELRRHWIGYSAIVLFFGVVGALAGLFLPKTYRAEAILQPVQGSSASGLASMLGQFGGLASLAGISLSGGTGDTIRAVALLGSRELTREFVHENDLFPVLFWKKWDPVGQKWLTDDPEKIPTDWDVYRLFEKRVRTITENRRTGIVSLAINWRDRELAAKWANDYVALADRRMRELAIEESESRIKLLEEELAKGPAIGVQDGIYRLIQAEIQRIVLAKSAEDFSFRVLDPAVVPDEDAQVRPRPALYTLIGLFFGAAVAGVLMLWQLLRPRRSTA
jgi:uncharacterized protein involved in exopolysaccharide biosynthesis